MMVSIQKSFLRLLPQRLVVVLVLRLFCDDDDASAIMSSTTARQRKAVLLLLVHFSLFSLSFSLSLSPRVVVSRGKAFKRIKGEKKSNCGFELE